jgi:hypothetical protein
MTDSACAVLLAAALSASAVVPAYGQTQTGTTETPAQTTTTPTQTTTTPTQTTTTPTETTPPPSSPEPTSAPNEYVESVPTGGGQSPATPRQETGSSTPVAPAPATTTPATPSGTEGQSTEAAPSPRKAHKKKQRRTHERRRPDDAPARAPALPSVPSTPAAADAGEPANPLLLGLAVLLITVGVLRTAVANRQGAGA